MKSSDALNAIRTLLGMEVKLAQMKLENGTVLEAEAFEADYEVFIVTEDQKVALPVGEYALEDGRILSVVEEGIISEIKEVSGEEVPESEAPVEEAPAEMAEETLYVTKEEFASAIEEIKAMIEKMVEMKSELSEEVKEETQLSADEVPAEVKEELSNTAAAKPIKHNPESNTQKQMFKLSPNKNLSTRDRVFQKIANL